METNKILTADVLDIIFEGKNKEYGAYQLRKGYRKTLTKAMLITGSTLLLVLGGTVLANIINDDGNRRSYDTIETTMTQITTEEPLPPPQLPPPEQPKLDVKQIIFTPPVIVDDAKVKPDEIIRDIDDAVISNKNVESDNTKPIVQAPVDEEGTKVVEIKKDDDENAILTFVEIEAGFPGGEAAWKNYLERTLNRDMPTDNGAEPGVYKVIVKFVVNKDGTLKDITCENDPGFGLCKEAIRVIKMTKNWIPAIQNGRNVNAYRRQPITWSVGD
jgi:protein TonB